MLGSDNFDFKNAMFILFSGAKLSGAKFFWYQIVHFYSLIPNCLGAKLSIFIVRCKIVVIPNCLVPNCLGAKLSGAKLPWCQIVRCQIVLVPNCPVPNCPGAKLSWCQIVHFYYLGAKLSAFIILVPNCPLYYLGAKLSGAKLSGAKLSYNQNQVPYFSFQTYTSPK